MLKTKWKNKTAKKEYLQLLINSSEVEATNYDMSRPHQIGQLINHPKFGIGFIQGTIGENRIQVFFEESERVLLQNWIKV